MAEKNTGPKAAEMQANKAMAALKGGNTAGAQKKARAGLAKHPGHPALLQVLGLAALQAGDAATAAKALERSLEAAPNQPALWEILGGALETLERYEDALAAYETVVDMAPGRAASHRSRGICLLKLKRFDDALSALAQALKLDPGDGDAWFWSGSVHFAKSDLEPAEAAFDKAIALRPTWHKAWLNRATVRVERGHYETTLEDYQKAMDLSPNDPAVLSQFAITLWYLHHIGDAERMFKKSLALEPENAATLANLAAMFEQSNRLEEAARYTAEVLAQDSDNLLAQKTSAVLERRNRNAEQALEQLTGLSAQATSRGDKEPIAFELAQLYEKLGDPDKAYAHFVEANRLQSEGPAGRRIDPDKYLKQVAREVDILASSPPEEVALPGPDDPPDPVFLMGFPRSRTTLLDQVLDSHPEVVVMEARPPLAEVHERLTALEGNAGNPFTRLSEEQRQAARHFYFQRVANFVDDFSGKTFIDKHPLSTAKVRIIKLLFPRARIVFALRHPCDVVLSSFMQRFVVNMAMSNFRSLAGAVKTYEAVMSLWHAAEPVLNMPVHYIRYEDLVQDFEGQVKGVLSFLDLPWDKRVASFHEHARNRDVRTASSRQVTQPLYTSALARWQRYAPYLEPHMETLKPFIDAFGYSSKTA